MLRYAMIAGIGALSAVGAAKAVTAMDQARAPAAERAAIVVDAPAQAPAAPTSSAASIAKARDGHYWAEARVNNSQVRFLVDTGATAVALTTDDARRLGFSPSGLTYGYTVTTASGQARAAKVMLNSISIAGARVNNVEALVIEKGLDTSLLGMTYLGRLSRWEATPNALILRP